MPGKIEVLEEGIWCNNCGWLEDPDCLPAEGVATDMCTGCGCRRYVHVKATVITEGDKA